MRRGELVLKCNRIAWESGLAIIIAIATSGCSVYSDGRMTGNATYFGLVHIERPVATGELQSLNVKTLGLGWDSGPFFGWRNANWVIADPAQCQMLIVIRSSVEATQAATVLDALKGDDICVADYTKSLRPQP